MKPGVKLAVTWYNKSIRKETSMIIYALTAGPWLTFTLAGVLAVSVKSVVQS